MDNLSLKQELNALHRNNEDRPLFPSLKERVLQRLKNA